YDAGFNQFIWLIWGLALLSGVLLVVREVGARLMGWRALLTYEQVRGLSIIGASVLVLGYGVLYVGTIQFTQSRFIFPGMTGIAILTLVGVDRLLPGRFRPAAMPVLLLLLVGLNVVSLVRYVIPFYYGPGGGGVLLP
ncbi:MAG: hypothetical protein H0T91_03260, partial [Propionibacteriaceae bacterium]|nr:hypothetical protein [Propionibacteriaceae bacterium]